MTILPPYEAPYKPVPQVTPFTYRDGVTMLKKLDLMQRYINRELVPFVNDNMEALGDDFETQANALIEAVNAAIALILGESVEIQDPLVAEMVNDPESATSTALNTLFASIGIENIVEVGRLSETSLNAAYASKATETTVNSGRLTQANLDAAYSEKSIQPVIQQAIPNGLTGVYRFDAASAVYGYDIVPRAISKLLADAATAHKKVVAIGHSLVSGNSGVAWPTLLRNTLASSIPQNTGIVKATMGGVGAAIDPQWAIGAGWNPFSSESLTSFLFSNAASSLATFTSDRAGTIVDVWTNGQSAAFEYKIDAGAWTTFTPTANFNAQKLTVTGLSNTTHVVQIRSLTTAVTYLIGVEVRNATGLSITNDGVSGSISGQWTNSTWYTNGPLMSHMGPWDLAFIQLSVNDMRNAVAASTYKANIQAIIDRLKLGNAAVQIILCTDPQPNPVAVPPYGAITPATALAYRQAAYELADTNGIRVFDINAFFGTYDQANARGVMLDSVHLNAEGYRRVARGIDRAMVG